MIYFEDIGSTGQMKSIRNQQTLKLADANNGHGEKVFALCSSKLWNTSFRCTKIQHTNSKTKLKTFLIKRCSSFCFQILSFDKYLGHNGGCACYTNVQELFRLFQGSTFPLYKENKLTKLHTNQGYPERSRERS